MPADNSKLMWFPVFNLIKSSSSSSLTLAISLGLQAEATGQDLLLSQQF